MQLLEDSEYLPSLRMSPPASFDGLTDDRFSESRRGTLGRHQDDAMLANEGQRLRRSGEAGHKALRCPQRAKRPRAEATSHRRDDPGHPDRHIKSADLDRPLTHRARHLKQGDRTEKNARDMNIFVRHFRPFHLKVTLV